MSIESTAQQFAKAVEKAKNATVNYVYSLSEGLTKAETLQLLDRLDFETIIGEKYGLNKAIGNVTNDYTNVLKGLESTAPVTGSTLQALVNIDQATYLSMVSDISAKIQKELVKGVLTGQSASNMRAILAKTDGLRPDQVQTLIDTTMRTFSRSVTSVMAEQSPPDTKYVYMGPVDDRTRDICLEMAGAGAMTKNEIDSAFPGAFVDGGGFNCRHRWSQETPLSSKFTDQQGAQKVISEKPNWSTPQTLMEKQLG